MSCPSDPEAFCWRFGTAETAIPVAVGTMAPPQNSSIQKTTMNCVGSKQNVRRTANTVPMPESRQQNFKAVIWFLPL